MAILRLGLLGAAKIAPAAIVSPANACPDVRLTSLAARNPDRAASFAKQHGIPAVHSGYEAMLDSDEIDAVYIPLPNGLHGEWAIRALDAGKHVLCEKPVAANAAEARAMANAAERTGNVLMEAFHYRYHPLARRMVEIVRSGELGDITSIRAAMCFPLPLFSDIRYQFPLAGGAMMDAGCYAVNMLRMIAAAEPEAVSATATRLDANIDRAMTASLRFPGGCEGSVIVSMWSRRLLDISLTVIGTSGRMRAINPVMPQLWHRLSIQSAAGKRVETLGRRPSYLYQLEAFAGACLRGEEFTTTIQDGIANMNVIDSIYRAAGMEPRRPAASFR